MIGLKEQDTKNIWHPFTQHKQEKNIIPILHSQGASLFTEDGQEIIDCISSWWTITHGHNHPFLNRTLKEQVDKLSHVMFAGFTHEPAIELSNLLLKALNHKFDKLFFSDNGSTAVEVALKLSYQWHFNKKSPEKTIFLAFDGAYHGDTFGAMATGRTTGFYSPFEPFLTSVLFLPYPDRHEDNLETLAQREADSLQKLDDILIEHHQNVCCFILEPLMQGAKGMRFARPEFIKKICQKLRDAGILIIFDEVATGFGRTGSLFALEQIDFIPDFLCLSKGLTAGYMPLSVTLTHNKVYNDFLGDDFKNAFTHGHSFTANPLACSVAVASLKLFESKEPFEQINLIQSFYQSIKQELSEINSIENIRILGIVLAWDLKVADSEYKSAISEKLKDEFLRIGLNIRPLGKTFYLLPPYCITQKQLEEIIYKIKKLFREMIF